MLCSSACAVTGVSCEPTAAPVRAATAIHLYLVELMTAEITRTVLCRHFVCRQPLPRLASTALPYDVACILIGPQTLVAGVAQLAVACPLGEADLGDQLRAHPSGAGVVPQSAGERRRVLFDGRQPLVQAAQRGFVETGPHFTGRDKVAAFVVADQQRTQLDSAAFRGGVTADDELLVADALEFQR